MGWKGSYQDLDMMSDGHNLFHFFATVVGWHDKTVSITCMVLLYMHGHLVQSVLHCLQPFLVFRGIL